MFFSQDAQWIWHGGDATPRNGWLRFRHAFMCASDIRRATLMITADSRYQLYVNAHEVGNGPVRSFPWAYSYDEYDVTSRLHSERENVLAIRVVHWGDHTFQYILGRGGLLCEVVIELANGEIQRIRSNEQWLVAPDASMHSQTPRIALQQGFEEQYDARREDGWLTTPYTSSVWELAHVVGPVGVAPWTELQPRTIPFLTRDVVLPSKVLAAEIAQSSPGYRWSLDQRHRVKDIQYEGIRAEPLGTRGVAFATEIIASQDCTVKLAHANGTDYVGWRMACNGQKVEHEVHLHEGHNLFVIARTEWPALYFQTSETLLFDASRLVTDNQATNDTAWVYLGPFDERDDTYEHICTASDSTQLPAVPRVPIAVSENMEDIFLLTTAQRYALPPEGFCVSSITRAQPRESITHPPTPFVEQPHNLLHQNDNYTLVYPQQEGDVHLIIDFGREIVGYPVLEVDAAEGTIIDGNCFEGIDESGIFWTWGLRNSFRYTCREGQQLFQSQQRRGFRYAAVTIRFTSQAARPLKLYNVRSLLSTYPVEQRGSFACNDAVLNRIWEVAAYTVQLCMEDTYVDCPAYEQVFWVGDARNSALVNAVAFGAYELTSHCLTLTGQSLSRQVDMIKAPHTRKRTHLTTDHVGSGWFSEIPMWTFLWIWNVWEHYLITGDRAQLAALYADVRECLQRSLSFLSPRGLLNIPDVWNLVDWSAMDLTRDGEVTSSSALLVACLRKAALMAEVLGEPADHYLTAAERLYAAINAYCWSEERGAYVDTVRDEQGYEYHRALAEEYGTALDAKDIFLARTRISEHTNTLILLCECAPTDRIERILPLAEAARNGKFIGSSPEAAPHQPAHEIVPVGSPWFLFFTAETLLAHQRFELVVQLIREQWGRMLEKGATTFWETFPNPHGQHWSRSLCHGWSAAPAYFLSTYVLGVQPTAPGFTSIQIAPQWSDLQWAKGTVPTPLGDVDVSWHREAQSVEIEVHAPAQAQYEIVLPKHAEHQPTCLAGVQGIITDSDDKWRITFADGSYTRYRLA